MLWRLPKGLVPDGRPIGELPAPPSQVTESWWSLHERGRGVERSRQATPQKPLPLWPSQNKLARYPGWRTAHSNSVRATVLGPHSLILEERLQRYLLERGAQNSPGLYLDTYPTYQSALGQVSLLHRVSVSPSVKWLLEFDDL